MAIVEILTGTLGAAIGKFVFALWLGKPDLNIEGYSTLVDGLFEITKDFLTARRGDRQFQVISEKAAERLSYLYDVEFRGWTEERITPIIYSVTKVIEAGKITPSLLAKTNLEPDQLKQNILKSSRGIRTGLSPDEISLFDRLLSQSCELIIDFTGSLPSVTQRTTSEILNREDQILKAINEVALQVKQVQESHYDTPFGINTSKYSLDYTRTLIRKLEWMELFGAGLSSASKRHRLNVAYINLSMQSKLNGNDEKGKVLRADQVIQEERCLFIRGAAGSGKTTLLKWIAVQAATKSFEGKLEKWNDLTPFLIRLRECVDLERLPQPEEFPKLIAPTIHDTVPKHWVHNLFANGEAIVLIDGVDEISRRDEVSKWIDDLTSTFEKVRFIVTSRPLIKSDPWETPYGFVEAELLPMNSIDITKFIQFWHEAVKEELNDTIEKENMDALGEELATTIFKRPALRNLASSPLLCAMICALHKDTDRRLPQNRLDLYEACTKMLIKEREEAQGIQIKNYPQFAYKESLHLLSDLAYYLLENGYSEVSSSRAKDTLSRSLKSLPNQPGDLSPSKTLAYFVERSGMVFEPANNKIAFVHRTFQEYLAAYAAVEKDDIGVLAQHAKDPLWREVIILAAGQAKQSQRNELLRDLLSTNENSEVDRNAVDLLAIACMETVPDLDPHIQNTLIDRLKKLVPPRNIYEASALAGAGDLAVPHLSSQNCKYAFVCIKALEMIGTELAVQELIHYVNSDDRFIIKLLMETLRNLSNNETTRTQLASIHVPSLEFENPVSLEIFRYVRNVSSLELSKYRGVQIDDVGMLSELIKLRLINCKKLIKLRGLEKLGKLEELVISGCVNLSFITEVSELQSLRKLTLRQLTLKDVNEISKLRTLEELVLEDMNITKLPSLRDFNHLTKLRLSRCYQLSDIGALKSTEATLKDRSVNYSIDDNNAPNLVEVVINQCPLITDLSDLEKKQHLRTIQVSKYLKASPDKLKTPYRLREKIQYRDN